MTENSGGVEAFLMNNFRSIDRSKMQWDFLCNSHEPIAYEEEILAAGSRPAARASRSMKRNCMPSSGNTQKNMTPSG